MRKLVLTALAAVGLLGCKQDAARDVDQVREAKDKQAEATLEYEQAKSADTSEYAKLKAGTKKIIADNERRIAEFRLSIKDKTAGERTRLNERIESLEARNEELRKDLDRFGDRADERWDSFKARVNKNVEDIRRDIDDLRNDNK